MPLHVVCLDLSLSFLLHCRAFKALLNERCGHFNCFFNYLCGQLIRSVTLLLHVISRCFLCRFSWNILILWAAPMRGMSSMEGNSGTISSMPVFIPKTDITARTMVHKDTNARSFQHCHFSLFLQFPIRKMFY